MALVLSDRVQETANSPGTGAVTLLGAVTGYQTFATGVGNGNTCYYCIADQGGSLWEVGIGTYSSSGNTLTRTTPLSGSNTTPVNFLSGTQAVFVTYPAEKSVNLDASGNVSPLGTISSGTWQGTTIGVAYGGTGTTTSTGTGSVVLSTNPVLVTPNLGTPSAVNLTNGTALPLTTGVSGVLPTANGGTNLSSFTSGGAVYATSTTALTTGTLPIASGGTNGTSAPTLGGVPYGTGTAFAFTAAGSSGQVLTSNGASAPTWQSAGTSSGTYTRTAYTATAGQTSFAVSYTPGYVQVYLNGLLLDTTDYTASSGAAVVLNTGANAGDLFVAIAFTISTVMAGTYTRTNATATAGQTTFSATYSAPYVQVYVNGVLLNPADYTATSGTTIVLAVAATAGDIVETISYYVASIVATPPIAINSTEIASNTTINSGTNGFSVGPMTIDSGVTVTVGAGQRWVVI